MKAEERVVELLDMEIGIYTVLRGMLVAGELEVVSVVAGTDGSRPDHYVFRYVHGGDAGFSRDDTPASDPKKSISGPCPAVCGSRRRPRSGR